jgi:PAS domain S-box-containing protein
MGTYTTELFLYAGLPLLCVAMLVLVVKVILDVRSPRVSKVAQGLGNRNALLGALMTLLLGTGVSVYWAGIVHDGVRSEARKRFMQLADLANADVQDTVNALVTPLNGVRGAFAASAAVDRHEFGRLIASMEIDRYVKGVRGLGWIERVPRAGIAAFEVQQRRQGRPDFRVQAGCRGVGSSTGYGVDDAYIVKYIEPLQSNAAALGFDIACEARRLAAAQTAMGSGRPAMTQPIHLQQDVEHRPGFLLLVPAYRPGAPMDTPEQRARALQGWAYAPVVWAELLVQTNTFADHHIDVRIYSGPEESTDNLLYDSLTPSQDFSRVSASTRPVNSVFTVTQPVLVQDQIFYVRTAADANFEAQFDLFAHRRLALWGGSCAVLAAVIVWLLLAGRSRALTLAQRMTSDLARLAMVAQRTTNGVVITDVHNRVTWVNEGFTRISGFSMEDVLGQEPGHALAGDTTNPDANKLIERGLLSKDVVKTLIFNRHKDGHAYWAEIEIQPLYENSGSHAGFMAMLTDVTEIVNARAALTAERERFDAILAGTNVGTWQSNLQTGESRFNDRWGQMMGFAPHEVQPNADQFWAARVHPDDLVRASNAMQRCRQGASDEYSIEVRVRRKDDSWMWILSRAKVMSRADSGDVEWIGGIHTDISETKQLELSLRDMESFLHRAGRLAGVGAWEIDLKTRSLTWSDQTCLIYGLEPGDQLSLDESLTFYAQESKERLQTAMRLAIEEGSGWDLTLSMVNARGASLWVRSTGEPEFDDSGAVRLVGAFQDVTQQRHTQISIERSEAILRGSIDAIGEAFVLYDPQDRLLWCNEKFRQLYATSADLIVPGATFESIIRGGAERGQYKDAVGRVDDWVQERIRVHRSGSLAMVQRLDDGRWLRVIEQHMSDGHIVGFRIDITELMVAHESAKAANAALSTERTRLQNIIEGTNVGTWEWDVTSDALHLNERCAELVGMTLAELEPLSLRIWIRRSHPDDREHDHRSLQEHFAHKTEFFATETRLRHADGSWVWVQNRGRVNQWGTEGAPLRMSGTYMDITERKSSEMALAQTSATLQVVLDSAVDVGIVATDIHRLIRVFNKGAENLLGYGASEVIGKLTPSHLLELSQLTVIRESLSLVLGREPSVQEVFEQVGSSKGQNEWALVRKDGSVFTAAVAISPMHDAHGGVTGFLGVVHDITRQKEYEASLRDAMRQAEQSSIAKSQFLANMSHEIRTPMNAILGMLKLLQTTQLSPRQLDYAGKTEGAARSLLGLLNDILDFSKVEAGKMQLDPEPFELNALLDDLSVILSSNLGQKNVELLFEVDPNIPQTLVGDALRLKQILINLGGNAVKFTEQGQVTLRCRLLALHTDRLKLEFAVQDSGIGIAPENRARIFEAFTQAESNTTRRYGGTGLGLVISTRLIRLMGGELQLASVVGEGSTFSFQVELALPHHSDVQAGHANDAPRQTLRALLVDDNPKSLASSASMMKSLGWEVTQAACGEDAVACVRDRLHDRPLDAIFVDWQMPAMDGWETLRNIRRVCAERSVPKLFLMSSQNRDGLNLRTDREQELLSGFLVKPLTANMFRQAVIDADAPSVSAASAELDASATVLPLAGMQLLVVEDNLINQQVARELLQSQGALVTLAENGKLGVEAVVSALVPFDAVLMDLQMPVMDGITATRTIRLSVSVNELPIIAMTANAMASDREACLAAGMNDHVGKPFDLGALVRTLVQHTGWTPAAPAARGAAPAENGANGANSANSARDANSANLAQMDWLQQSWPPSIDVVTALKRMGGNADLLHRSMVAYLHDAKTLGSRVQALYERSDWDGAQRELHSLKGLSATMGMNELSALAAEVEKLATSADLRAGFATRFGMLCERLDAMHPVLAEVAQRLSFPQGKAALSGQAGLGTQEGAEHALTLTPTLTQQFDALHAALAAGDMAAMELHANLRQQVSPAMAAAMEPLDTAVAGLEFGLAATECQELMEMLITRQQENRDP